VFTVPFFQRKQQIGQTLYWHMNQFGLLELARLQPLLRLRRYNLIRTMKINIFCYTLLFVLDNGVLSMTMAVFSRFMMV
jgi:hypothetical protein